MKGVQIWEQRAAYGEGETGRGWNNRMGKKGGQWKRQCEESKDGGGGSKEGKSNRRHLLTYKMCTHTHTHTLTHTYNLTLTLTKFIYAFSW